MTQLSLLGTDEHVCVTVPCCKAALGAFLCDRHGASLGSTPVPPSTVGHTARPPAVLLHGEVPCPTVATMCSVSLQSQRR